MSYHNKSRKRELPTIPKLLKTYMVAKESSELTKYSDISENNCRSKTFIPASPVVTIGSNHVLVFTYSTWP